MTDSNELETKLLLNEGEPPVIATASVIGRLHRRVISFVCVTGLLCYVNRNNIGFAANGLCADLGLSNAQYGLGLTLHFSGNLVLKLIGNEFLKPLGVRVWLFLLCIAWGSMGMALGFVQNRMQFYFLMGFMGVSMGSVFPALLHHVCEFYPSQYLDSAFGALAAAIAFSIPVTSVMSVALLEFSAIVGCEGWRLMLAAEGALPILLSVILLFGLPVSPEKATFLTRAEKLWLAEETIEKQERKASYLESLRQVLTNVQVVIASISLLSAFGVESVLTFFINLTIRTALNGKDEEAEEVCGTTGGHRTLSVALTAVPYLIGGVLCIVLSRYGDRLKNRKCFAMTLQLISAVLLIVWSPVNEMSFVAGFVVLTTAVAINLVPTVIILSLAAASVSPDIRGLAMSFLTLMYSISGLLFPWLMGIIADAYGYGWCVTMTGCLGIVSAVLIALLRDPIKEDINASPEMIEGDLN